MSKSAQVEAWDAGSLLTPADGIEVRMLAGDAMTVMKAHFAVGGVMAAHSHPHEQITMVVSGALRVTAGGTSVIVEAGEVLKVPGNVDHESVALEETQIYEAFAPRRTDLEHPTNPAG